MSYNAHTRHAALWSGDGRFDNGLDQLVVALLRERLFVQPNTAHEPMGETPLEGAPRCILTPHIAWAPYETRCRLISIVAQNLRAWIEGHPQNRVG